MHRKKIRRWHKLLSASGIIVALFGAIVAPSAYAQVGGPRPMGIYGPSFSKENVQVQYIDFSNDIMGLEPSDLFITGTVTGCVIEDFPTMSGFSFGILITGCSDGILALGLKAESVAYFDGKTGPTSNYVGMETLIDRTPLVMNFLNLPAEFNSSSIEMQVIMNHPIYPGGPYQVSVSGDGCSLVSVSEIPDGLSILIDGCANGANVGATLAAMAVRDVFGNLGPATQLLSPLVPVILPMPVDTATPAPTVNPDPVPSASATPEPTPPPVIDQAITSTVDRVPAATPEPSASASPTSSPTPTPTPSPSASASVSPIQSDSPPSVAVTMPPTDPPAPPVVVQQEPIAPEVSDAEPVFAESEPSVSLPPIAISRSKIVQVRKEIAEPVAIAEPITEQPAIVDPPALPIAVPAIETSTPPSFNWQPIGYAAMVIGTAAGAVGGGILLQRITKVRRMKFS